MGKYFKLLVLAMLVSMLAIGTALAGTTKVNHAATATALKIATETTAANRTAIIQASAALTKANYNDVAPISFSMTQALSSGNLIVVTFEGGAAFDGQQINVCAINTTPTGIIIATATPAVGTTNQAFNLVDVAQAALGSPNVAAGNHIWLSNSATCAIAANAVMPVLITTGATTPTVKISQVTAGNVPLDTSTAVNVATIVREFNVTNASTSHTIDYLASGATGNKILNGSNTTSQITADSQAATAGVNVVAFTRTTVDYATNVAAGNYGAGLNVTGVISVTDPDQSWSGVNRVYILQSPAQCNDAGNIVAASNSPSGTVNFAIGASTGAGNFPGAAGTTAMGYGLCVQGNGSTLSTRTIKAQGIISVSGGGSGTQGSVANAQVWGINGYQAIIPWSMTLADAATYCLINNGNTTGSSANVLFEAVSSEGGIAITSTNIGTVAIKTSKLLLMNDSSACLSADGATCSPAGASLTTLGASKRYSAKLTITGSPANITMTCVQKDAAAPSGLKRVMPVLTDSTSTSYFKQ